MLISHTITNLDIIYHSVFYLKHNVTVEPTQLGLKTETESSLRNYIKIKDGTMDNTEL
jgi:hypothetical protein